VYGRGVVDTKGLLAALIIALEAYVRHTGQVPVSLALTSDEEQTDARGAALLAPRLQGHEVIVLEPTNGQICLKQAGSLEFRLHARGEPAHAATYPRAGDNPIHRLMALVPALEDALGLPVHVLQIRGGWPHYAVPRAAWLLAEVILPMGWTWREAEARVLEVLRAPAHQGRVRYHRVDAEDPLELGGHWAAARLRAAYEPVLGHPPPAGVMPSWTDAASFVRGGVASVVFGLGDLAVAHTPHERLALTDLTHMAQGLYRLFAIFDSV